VEPQTDKVACPGLPSPSSIRALLPCRPTLRCFAGDSGCGDRPGGADSNRHSKNRHGLSPTTNFCMNGPMSFRGGRAALAQFISIWAGVNIEARTTPSGLAAKA
jgi:hypothetical protein